MKRWSLLLIFACQTFCHGTYYSQCGQDAFVHQNFFQGVQEGVFVDIGAHNGISLSNTYFFEKELGWNGICVEPIPEVFDALRQNRNCICVQGCIVSEPIEHAEFWRITGAPEMLSGLIHRYDPKHRERIRRELKKKRGALAVIDVRCYRLNELLEAHQIDHVHFLSIDTEGGELEILKSIDFDRFQIDVIAVENNYQDPHFAPFMESKGYFLAKTLEQDQIFVKQAGRERLGQAQ
ncbi:MAG: FkbM family methyltransferase [Verrucomicrobia bacterium]|nr:FkbM family methyltransferase [Verrucomicrobiota bacterium]